MGKYNITRRLSSGVEVVGISWRAQIAGICNQLQVHASMIDQANVTNTATRYGYRKPTMGWITGNSGDAAAEQAVVDAQINSFADAGGTVEAMCWYPTAA